MIHRHQRISGDSTEKSLRPDTSEQKQSEATSANAKAAARAASVSAERFGRTCTSSRRSSSTGTREKVGFNSAIDVELTGVSVVQLRSLFEPGSGTQTHHLHHHHHRPPAGKQMPKERRRSSREVAHHSNGEGGVGAGVSTRERKSSRSRMSDSWTGANASRAPSEGEVGGGKAPNCLRTPSVPQLTITPSGGGSPREMGEDWNDVDGPLRRKMSNSSISSNGSTVCEESEDDILSDNETKSQGIVTLEPAEDTPVNRPWRKLKTIVHWPFIVSQRKRYSWIQLAGHKGNFKAGEEGTVLKKFSENEKRCFERLMGDVLYSFVPAYHGIVEREGEPYLQLTDLLGGFNGPCVMDCKIGVRHPHCIPIPPSLSETPALHTHPSLIIRDTRTAYPSLPHYQRHLIGSPLLFYSPIFLMLCVSLQKADGTCSTDFKRTKTQEQVTLVFRDFVEGNKRIMETYLAKLEEIRRVLESSEFFKSHEVIGSSLLFIHDHNELANVWLIDFGKTTPLSEGQTLTHRAEWCEGNREDGYLWGLDNMVSLVSNIARDLPEKTVDNQDSPEQTG
ncbi:inositol-trisphosphate 3-kinase A [Huso huso]|uniref:Kinase n=1 Tax=Huso huso TaxID=61971 RepID=A0ABR0Z2D7_HUSHU